MKKFLLSALSAVFCITSATAAVGDTFVSAGVTYRVTSATEAEVYDVDTSLTNIPLSETVSDGTNTYTLTAIGEKAFYWSKITSVTLPNTITTLGYGAFMSCDNLSDITFGTGLVTIGDYAFYGAKFTTLSIPEGVETIGENCFFTSKELTSITFPSTLKSIGRSCFYKCQKLTNIVLPDGLETLGAKAFMSCNKLSNIRFNESLTEIGEGTFYECKALKNVNLPTALTTIGNEAFYNSGLESIYITKNVQTIGGAVFSGTQVSEFQIDPQNNYFTTKDGILYTADKTLLISLPPVYAPTHVTVDANCIGISYGAFDQANITSVTLNNQLRAIDECAFVNSKLTSISFPESVVFIGEQAFGQTQITELNLPKNLTYIQDGSFAGNHKLHTVTIPAAVKQIAIRAFTLCDALTTINVYSMEPPLLDDWYEAYECPFYDVPSNCVVNIPVGTLQAYKSSYWGQAFSASQFHETLPASILSTEATPAAGSTIESFDGVTLNFGQTVTVANSRPEVSVIKGQMIAGIPLGEAVDVESWIAVTDNGNGRVFPADADGFTAAFDMEADNNYYVVIPAGTFKNSAGELNEEVILNYVGGKAAAPSFTLVSVDPENGSTLSSLSTMELTFSGNTKVNTSKVDMIKAVKADSEATIAQGTEVDVDQWMSLGNNSNKITIFPADWDGYVYPISIDNSADLFIIIPAGTFTSVDGNVELPAMTLRYTNGHSVSVETIAADSAIRGGIGCIYAPEDAVVYNLRGIVCHADNLTPGLYIVRHNGTSVKVVVK